MSDSSGNAAETEQRVVQVTTGPDCPADTEPPVILVQGKVLKKFNQVRQHHRQVWFVFNGQEYPEMKWHGMTYSFLYEIRILGPRQAP